MTERIPLRRDRAALLIALIALLCYLPGFWWGAPHATAADRTKSWGVDDETPLGPLAEMSNILHPRADRNLGYPLLYSFVTVAAYTPYLGALKVSGGFDRPSGEYPFGLKDPDHSLRVLSGIAHLVTVLFAMVAVVAAYDTGRSLWGKHAGILAALFAMTLYPMFYYGRTGNVDVPMLAFLALTMAALARALADGMTVKRAVWIGVFAGLSLATKEAAAGALLPAALCVLVLGWKQSGWKAPAFSLLASLLALGVMSGLFVDPHRWMDHIRFLSGRVQDVPGTVTIPAVFPFTAHGNLGFASALLLRFVETMTLPGFVLGMCGLLCAWHKNRRLLWLAACVPAYVLVEFVALRSAQLRYVLPPAWLLAVFAGWAVWAAWQSRSFPLQAIAGLAAAASLSMQLYFGASLTWLMLHDTRHAAGEFIASRVRPGDRVEYFGAQNKVPPIPTGVTTATATPFHGMWGVHRTDEVMADSIWSHWAEQLPALVIVMPDHSTRTAVEYDASVPPSLYADLLAGTRGMVLVAAWHPPAPWLRWPRRPALDYPSVSPPIRIFAPRLR